MQASNLVYPVTCRYLCVCVITFVHTANAMVDLAISKSTQQERRVSARPYDWPHDGTLSRGTTALVVIDMQNDCKSISYAPPPTAHVCTETL